MTSHSEQAWTLCARRSQQHAPFVDGRLRLAAEVEWVLTADPETAREVWQALPRHADRLGPNTLLIQFGNSVGQLDLPHLGPVIVTSGKWGDAAFEGMLADLVETASNLPFSAGDGPLLPLRMGVTDASPVDYHAFVYLRHILSDAASRENRLLPALERIVRDPHRRWRRESSRVPLDRMGRVDAATVAGLMGAPLHRVDSATGSPASEALAVLASRLRGYLPETVLESRVQTAVDTPENRFVKRFLDECLRLIARTARLAQERGGAFGRRLHSEADMCGQVLERVRRAPLWSEVGKLQHLPASSTVLRNRRGYREVFAHWIRLRRTAELPLDTDGAMALVEAKDIALLYELWCYFQVVEAVTRLLGAPRYCTRIAATEEEAVVEHEFMVEWEGVRLAYNGRFARSARTRMRRAYSLPLRPDIVLEDRRGGSQVVHLLDAKFRVRPMEGTVGGDERLTFKSADVHKMHAYRDAISHARSAWVLYPGTEDRQWLEGDTGGLSGVGVVGLRPEGCPAALISVLERFLRPEGQGVGSTSRARDAAVRHVQDRRKS